MQQGVWFILLLGLALFQSAYSDLEIVWVKDMTSNFQKGKRTLNDADLPVDLTFHLSHGSHDWKLKLNRNYDIDPNAEVYFVRKLKDGRSHMEKALNLQTEDVAYYQNRKHGAFMTVRCVRRSNGQCDRVINGNIRIGNIHYDLRPAETDVTARDLFDVPYHAKRYVLSVHPHIRREVVLSNADAARVNTKNLEENLIDLPFRVPHGIYKINYFPPTITKLSSRNTRVFHTKRTTDKKNGVKTIYWVEIAVMIDSGIWDLHKSLISRPNVPQVAQMIKEFYSHIINGVNLFYHDINDNHMEIRVILRHFHIFQEINDFPHRNSIVFTVGGKSYIDAQKYLDDIANWDKSFGQRYDAYDHVMLFTRHDLVYDGIQKGKDIAGISEIAGVCDMGKRVSAIRVGDYFSTATTAAHELGHNLGAEHDGAGRAKACPAGKLFIMDADQPVFMPGQPYSINPWMFSTCSVDAFKIILKDKKCLTNEGVYFDSQLWMKYTSNLPGEKYIPSKQCQLANGPQSDLCGDVSDDICLFMRCKDPTTGLCMSKFFVAARGTKCGENKWCEKGRCVRKL